MAEARLRVVQCNILHGGWPYEVRGKELWVIRGEDLDRAEPEFTPLSYPEDRPLRGDPGTEFAARMHDLRPDVIGMQEVTSRDVDRLTRLLGETWRHVAPLDGHGASCIFWSSSTVAPVGSEEIEVVHNFVNDKKQTIPIRVLKQVFTHLASGSRFAMATGKSWYQARRGDRELRARRTSAFARRGGLTTVIAIDMSAPQSPAFKAMRPFVAKGNENTMPARPFEGRQGPKGRGRRADHVFYYSPRLRDQRKGILECRTGPFFGSDHLYVWADVKLL